MACRETIGQVKAIDFGILSATIQERMTEIVISMPFHDDPWGHDLLPPSAVRRLSQVAAQTFIVNGESFTVPRSPGLSLRWPAGSGVPATGIVLRKRRRSAVDVKTGRRKRLGAPGCVGRVRSGGALPHRPRPSGLDTAACHRRDQHVSRRDHRSRFAGVPERSSA